jgi:hypothetical protein
VFTAITATTTTIDDDKDNNNDNDNDNDNNNKNDDNNTASTTARSKGGILQDTACSVEWWYRLYEACRDFLEGTAGYVHS